MKILLSIVIGYLIGSIPWGLIIGKVFYNKDIRQYGSGNLGGTNAGRVLGAKAGISVVVLDALKAFIVMIILNKVMPGTEQYGGVAVCIGHCFPIFASFKGGKAVACTYGFLLGIGLFQNHEILLTFITPIIIFFILFIPFHMVSLGSMISVTCAGIINLIFFDTITGLIILALAAFVIYRHKANISRILNGTESKIYLFRKPKV